jgi:cytochrome c oxidase subunit 3
MHTLKVQGGIKLGMYLFIVSEIMFFFGFFWSFFHYSLCPSIFIGGIWPPLGIDTVNPYGLPMTNTVILLSSGVTVNCVQKSILYGNRFKSSLYLLFTIIYGLIFMFVQYFEYDNSLFSISDSIYGSIFYITTGFHGLHVVIGTIFLAVCLLRHYRYQLLSDHHIGLDCSIWY